MNGLAGQASSRFKKNGPGSMTNTAHAARAAKAATDRASLSCISVALRGLKYCSKMRKRLKERTSSGDGLGIAGAGRGLSLIHISEPTRLALI
eukprot:14889372-Alexandrium_andersonii.AAC.1